MLIRVANAPVSWGVEVADDPRNPPWQRVLDEIADAGYRWIELGPMGYLPPDVDVLTAELDRRDLKVAGSFLYEQLSPSGAPGSVLPVAERTCSFLAQLGARYVVIIDAMNELRMMHAGRGADAPRLAPAAWRRLVDTALRVAEVAAAHGLRAVFHPHVGTNVEFDDEIGRFFEDVHSDVIGLCIDTGHSAYAGVDPVGLYERYAPLVEYFHFKDVVPSVRDRVTREKLGWESAVSSGIFCPLGRGCVDFVGLRASLAAGQFDGWATVEQDTETGRFARAFDAARESLSYLRQVGLATAP